jgi:hypothetical protein
LNGLSGHIQWAHDWAFQNNKQTNNQEENKGVHIEPDDFMKTYVQNKITLMPTQDFDEWMQEKIHIRGDWFLVENFLNEQKILIDQSDYKSYLMLSMSRYFSNRRFLKRIAEVVSKAVQDEIKKQPSMAPYPTPPLQS